MQPNLHLAEKDPNCFPSDQQIEANNAIKLLKKVTGFGINKNIRQSFALWHLPPRADFRTVVWKCEGSEKNQDINY